VKQILDENHTTQLVILPANNGDAIIVKTFDKSGKPFNMVIDGGPAGTYEQCLKRELRLLPHIDIMILTHIDSDHIGGLIKYVKNPLFDPNQVKKYWFNSKNIKFTKWGDNISTGQAKTFEELLIDIGCIKDKWAENVTTATNCTLSDGINIDIISPSEEILEKLFERWPDLSAEYEKKLKDLAISSLKPSQIPRGSLKNLALSDDTPQKNIFEDLVNSSSIAFILKTFDMSVLFLGDAHPHFIEESLRSKNYSKDNKLKIDYVKISHHGSKNNTTNNLLDMIDCENFIISTNGGSSSHTHPDRETIARIIHHPERVRSDYRNKRRIFLNYPLSLIQSKAGEFINV
jgi:beta-lactamase superfamily II metal-dependent hydrolase